MILDILMYILAVIGIYIYMKVRIHYFQRLQANPGCSDEWSSEENKVRTIAIIILAIALIIAFVPAKYRF